MWAIKFLNGVLAGQTITLNQGRNTIGRSEACDIVVPTNKVSKMHAQIDINGNHIELTDLDSTNGTFINDVSIKSKKIFPKDKILINDIIFCLVHEEINNSLTSENHFPMESLDSSNKLSTINHDEQSGRNIIEKSEEFLETRVLPGIYSLSQSMGMKWALIIVLFVMTLAICIFSYIPAIDLMNERVLVERASKSRSTAKSLAEANREYILKNLFNSVNTAILGKTGAKKLYVLSGDKSIISPAILNGQKPKEPFIFSDKSDKSYTSFYNNNVGSIVPINFKNNRNDQIVTKGYAVAIFNTQHMSILHPRILAKFIQSIFIVLFVFALGVFFVYKMVDFPIALINKDLDEAFRSGKRHINETSFKYKTLSLLISNINSAFNISSENDLSAQMEGSDHGQKRRAEALNIAQMIGFPCLTVDAGNQSIIFCNTGFEDRVGVSNESLENQSLEEINDQALRLSLENLIERSALDPEQMHTNQLEINGSNSEIAIQSVHGTNDLAYFIITILPIEEESYNE